MKYVRCVNRQVEKMDWNPSCGGNMGFTVELLGSYYDINFDTLKPSSKPVPLTCGLLGIERIFDVINNGISPEEAIAMFLCGLARQAYSFCGSPEVIHLSGGFTRNRCFVATLQQYCKVSLVGRYMLVRGLLEIARKEHGLDLSALIMSASSRRNLTRIIM
jgi:activator of 2-hydroxyglutaryl-CoA dehydratase